MSGYSGNNGMNERCKYCGLEISADPSAMIAHLNNHWRQYNIESLPLSPCAFESQLDMRVGATSLNPDDLEVSGHMEQVAFPYTYSPQTEPSNLTITGARSSPLNLTGRAKSSSPLSSPQVHNLSSSPLSNHMTLSSPVSHQHTLSMNSHQSNHINSLQLTSQQVFQMPLMPDNSITSEGMNSHHQLPMSSNHTNMSCQLVSDLTNKPEIINDVNNKGDMISVDMEKRRRRSDNISEIRCENCDRIFYTRTSYEDHLQTHHINKLETNNEGNDYMLTNNNQNELDMREIRCLTCNKIFFSKSSYIEHLQIHHLKVPVQSLDMHQENLQIHQMKIPSISSNVLDAQHHEHQMKVPSMGPSVAVPNNQYLMNTEQVDMNQTVGNAMCSLPEKSYKCSICDQEFTYREELLEHNETHEAAKPHKCSICGIRVSHPSALRRHKLTHTGFKPHRCQVIIFIVFIMNFFLLIQ